MPDLTEADVTPDLDDGVPVDDDAEPDDADALHDGVVVVPEDEK